MLLGIELEEVKSRGGVGQGNLALEFKCSNQRRRIYGSYNSWSSLVTYLTQPRGVSKYSWPVCLNDV